MLKLFRKTTAQREITLRNGEKILIRQLTPSERLRLLSQPDEKSFCKRLSLGMIKPSISSARAKRLLNKNPFKALEIVRAIQSFTSENDFRDIERYESLENNAFLEQISLIGSITSGQQKNFSEIKLYEK